MTARELCTSILVELGVIASNETPDPPDIDRVFSYVNDLADSWSVDTNMVYAETDETFTLVPGTASYSIGPSGADFTTVRPGQIQRAWIRKNSVDYPIAPLNNDEYNSIGLKSIQTTFPQYLYYNQTFPNGTLKLWPVPAEALVLNLTSLKQFTRFSTLDTAVSLPPGYSRALLWNGVKEACGAFGKSISELSLKKAGESKAALQRVNSQNVRMTFDPGLSGQNSAPYNIYRDGSR